jgi:hypothetical protein
MSAVVPYAGIDFSKLQLGDVLELPLSHSDAFVVGEQFQRHAELCGLDWDIVVDRKAGVLRMVASAGPATLTVSKVLWAWERCNGPRWV